MQGLAIFTGEVINAPRVATAAQLSPDSDFHDVEDCVSAVSDQIPHANIAAFRRHARPQSRAKFDDSVPMSQLLPKYIHSGVAETSIADASSILLPTERQFASPPKTSRGYFAGHNPAQQTCNFNKLYQRSRFDQGFGSPASSISARAAMLQACISQGVSPEPIGVLRPIQETFDVEGLSMGEYRSGTVAAALKHMPNLQTLNLRENRLNGRMSAHLFEAVDYSQLQHIDIAKNHLHSLAVGLLCKGLAQASQLRALDVEGCRLSSMDAVRVVRCLRRCPQLQRLVLRENKLQDAVAYEFMCLLIGDDKSALKLDFLSDGRSERKHAEGVALGAVARRSSLTPSTAIGISPEDDGTGLGTLQDSSRFFERISQSLSLLDLAWNDFSATGCALIFQALRFTRVSALDFARNTVGSSTGIVGVDSMCQYLEENESLAHLNLSHCGLSVVHGEMLSQALHRNSTLRGLHLEGNDVTSDARGYVSVLHADAPAAGADTARAVATMNQRRHLQADDVPLLNETDCDEQRAILPVHTSQDAGGGGGDHHSREEDQPKGEDAAMGTSTQDQEAAKHMQIKYVHVDGAGGVSLPAAVRQHLAMCLEEMGTAWWSNSDVNVSNTHDMRSIIPRKQRASRKDWSDALDEQDSSLIKTLSTMRNLSQREKKIIRALEAQRVGMQEGMSGCWLCGRWRPVTFKYAAPISGPIPRRYVLLVTSFDDWVPQLLKPSADGSAYHLHRMVPSRPFYFAFVVDGVLRAGMDYNIAKVEQPREKGKSSVAGIARLLDQLKSADEVAQKGFIPPGTEFLNFMPAPGAELAKLSALTHAKLEAQAAAEETVRRAKKEAQAFDAAVSGKALAEMSGASSSTPESAHIASTLSQGAAKQHTRRRSMVGKMSAGSRRKSIALFADNWARMRQESERTLGLPQPLPPPPAQGARRTKRLSMLNVARAIAMPFKLSAKGFSPSEATHAALRRASGPSTAVQEQPVSGNDVHFGRRASAPSPSMSTLHKSPARRHSMLPAAQAAGNGNSVNGALGALTQNQVGATLVKYGGPPIQPRTGGSGDGTAYKPHVEWNLASGVFAGCKQTDAAFIRRCVSADMGYIGNRLSNMLRDEEALARVQELFEEHYALLVSVFKRYCLAGAGRGGAKDFFNVSFGGLRQLAFDTGVRELPGVVGADVDRMFIAADNKMSAEANNPYKALCRHEFLECLVRLAQLGAKEHRTGMQMAAAFQEFIEGPIKQRAAYDMDEIVHSFRGDQLWTEAADLAVRQYTEQLHNLHELFKCTRIQRIALATNAKALDGIDIISWLHLLELAGLIDKQLLGISEMDARVAFLFAKAIVPDEQSEASTHRVLSLPEMYEALGRLALKVQQVPDFEGVPFVAAFVEVLEFATSIVDESSDAYLHPDTISALRNRTTSLSLHKAGVGASLEQGGSDKLGRSGKAAKQLNRARSISKDLLDTHADAHAVLEGNPSGKRALSAVRLPCDGLIPESPSDASGIAQLLTTKEDTRLPSWEVAAATAASHAAVHRRGAWSNNPSRVGTPADHAAKPMTDTAEEVEESHGYVQSLASLRSAFHAFDVDGTGYLSMDEITQLLFDVGQSKGAAKRMLETMDANGDGEVSYNEFMAIAARMS